MNERRGPLLTWTTGNQNGPAILALHDRYKDYDEVGGLEVLPGARIVQVRSPRAQMAGSETLGYFWFLGPYERPELTTLGDGLHHLETLLLALSSGPGKARSVLVGKGEGGVIALTLAAIWPELLAGVVSIDGPLPDNIDSFPIELRPSLGLPILLIESERNLERTKEAMTRMEAKVDLGKVQDKQPIQMAVDWLADSETEFPSLSP